MYANVIMFKERNEGKAPPYNMKRTNDIQEGEEEHYRRARNQGA